MIFQGRLVLDGSLAQIHSGPSSQGLVRVRSDKSLKFLRGLAGVLSAVDEDHAQILTLKGDPQPPLKAPGPPSPGPALRGQAGFAE